MIIWLIGMSGSGKTTVGKELHNKLKEKNNNEPWLFIDGDIVREILGNDLGHTIEDRRKNAIRINNLCLYLDREGINVVCGVLSIFPEYQQLMREKATKYFEVYLKVTLEDLLTRDSKGLYKQALKGEIKNVVGVDIEFPAPENSDMVINNGIPEENPEIIAEKILQELLNK
ncbi:MAG: adenylyl-sulfate kinase [Candidatus Margulisiibacteriota bacterium]|jgi:adenylylsulfate kinase